MYCERNKHSFSYLISARRARQFYRMRETSLCDICEGSDCDKNCKIRASEQKSFFDSIEKEAEIVSGRSQATNAITSATSAIWIVLTATILLL